MTSLNPAAPFDAAKMLPLVSRTFALSIERLPGVLREAITLGYLAFRVSDFLEDNEAMPARRKVELLHLWERVLRGEVDAEELTLHLQGVDESDPEAAVARHAGAVLASIRRLPPDLQAYILEEARESALGMARWQARGPVVRDEDDLDDYMFEVAGRVGHMLTRIFAWYHKPLGNALDELMPLAREFGLALQTVNIIRGLAKDYRRGWIYVPESFCTQVGLKPPDLFKPEHIEASLQVIDMLADKAEGHLQAGLDYVKRIPRRFHAIRLACMWPLFFAVRTLAVSRDNARVLLDEAKISRQDVRRIVAETQTMGWSNRWLDGYYQRLSRV